MKRLYLFVLAATAVLSGAAPVAIASAAGAADALVSEFYSRFQKPGFHVDDLMVYYHPDIVFLDPTFEIRAEGKSEVRSLYAELGTERTAYKDIRWTIDSVISEGDHIVIRGRWSGRFHACDFDVEFMTLWRLKDGKIVEQNDFFAASAFDRQVGWDGETATCSS